MVDPHGRIVTRASHEPSRERALIVLRIFLGRAEGRSGEVRLDVAADRAYAVYVRAWRVHRPRRSSPSFYGFVVERVNVRVFA